MTHTLAPRRPPPQRPRTGVRGLIERWDRFWFEDVPSDAIAVTRIAVGTAGLVSLIGFTPVAMFWSPDGIAPVPAEGEFRDYLLASGLGVSSAWVIFLGLFAAFTCMILGLVTGPAILACFAGTLFHTRWNSLPLSSAHGLLLAALFCLLWAECGATLSVDEWRRRRTAALGGPAAPQVPQPIWPLRLLRIQIGILYVASGLFKFLGPTWRDGSAVYHSTHHNIYGRIFQAFPSPPALEWTFTLLTYATILWEMSFPVLLLHKTTRMAALGIGVAMHLGILATMEVGPFTLMILATYVAFLDPHAVAQRVRTWTSSRRSEQTRMVAASAAETPPAA